MSGGKKQQPIWIVFAVVAVALALFLFRQWSSRKSGPVQRTETVSNVINHDKQLLLDGVKEGMTEETLATSLIRLSYSSREEILPYIEKYKNHSSLIIQAAVVEAAGALNTPEMTKFLAEKLNSQEPSIRIAAIKGLMRHQSPEHLEIIKKEAILLNNAKDGKLIKSDAIWTSLALARITQDEKERRFYVDKVLERLSSNDLNLADEKDSREAAHQVLSVFQGDKNVIVFSQHIVEKVQDPDLLLHGLQYLMAYNKPWLLKNLGNLNLPKSGKYRDELAWFLNQNCTSLSSELLKKLGPDISKKIKCAK